MIAPTKARLALGALNRPLAISHDAAESIASVIERRTRGVRVSRAERREIRRVSPGAARIEKHRLDARFGVEAEGAGDLTIIRGLAVIPIMGPIEKAESCDDGMDSFGPMASTITIQKQLKQAIESTEVDSILLHIDSPGGCVDGCFELVDFIDAKIRGVKPLASFIDGAGMSAAYAIACTADPGRLFAFDTADTASIGVIAIITDLSGAQAPGVKTHIITTGDLKAAGHPLSEATPARIEHIQRQVNLLGDRFFGVVVDHRPIDLKSVVDLQGASILASQAAPLGLVDSLVRLDEVIDFLTAAGGPQENAAMAVETLIQNNGRAHPAAAPRPAAQDEPPAVPEPTPIVDDPADETNITRLREAFPALIAEIERRATEAPKPADTPDPAPMPDPAPAAAASFVQLNSEFAGNQGFIVLAQEKGWSMNDARREYISAMRADADRRQIAAEVASIATSDAAAANVGSPQMRASAQTGDSAAQVLINTLDEKNPTAAWDSSEPLRKLIVASDIFAGDNDNDCRRGFVAFANQLRGEGADWREIVRDEMASAI